MAWSFYFGCRILILFALSLSVSISYSGVNNNIAAAAGEYVLTLDHTNFSLAVSHHNFLVIQFWAPCEKMHKLLCKFGEELAPEYEKAASVLSTHEPPIVMAKIDDSADENKELADKFEVTGYPIIVISQNNGRDFYDYVGPKDADGIVRTLERFIDPSSIELKTDADAFRLIDEKKISIVGIFHKFYGEEFENFTVIANKLLRESWGFDVFHTSNASIIPRGEPSVITPTLRLLKPYDELSVDSQNFQVRAMENFIIGASFPLVTILSDPPPDIISQYLSQLPDEQVMLFLDSGNEHYEVFKSRFHNVAALHKCKGLRFVLIDAKTNEDDLKYSGLRFGQVPLILIDSYSGPSYMKPNLKPDDISPWLVDYKEGKLKPFLKSQPIHETNNDPSEVVVANSLEDML
ncbi:protein disulfide-isomerase-like [Rutidosis leptorrhynchoides]|uniref:protein disulfide-isomerase-like n=1 Tax=Rutidosis leptorrhynchoides TaxID=125765 RepID=UPI003A9A26B2